MAFSWWLDNGDDPIYRKTVDETLIQPDAQPALSMVGRKVTYQGHTDWSAPHERIDGWCEDRDPRAEWELTDLDGRE